MFGDREILNSAGSRGLIVFLVPPIVSHIYASMGLARRLQTGGWKVEYWGDSRVQKLAEDQGFLFKELAGIWPRYAPTIQLPSLPLLHPIATSRKLAERRRWRKRLPGALRAFEESLDSALAEESPTLVVFSPFRLVYYPYFRQKGIATVVLSSKPLATPDPLIPPPTSQIVPSKTLVSVQRIRLSWLRLRLLDRCRRFAEMLARTAGVYTFNDLLIEVGKRTGVELASARVRRWVGYDLHFGNVPEWALWTPDMDFPRRYPLPSNIFFIGPCVDLERRESGGPVLKSVRYVVYVAMGSALPFQWKSDIAFLKKIIRALKDVPEIEVVLSTGDARVTVELGSPPDNFRFLDFVAQLQALDKVDVVLTHAGSNTFRECIAKEVPMLAYPREHDQFGNAARIVALGIGLRGNRRWNTAATIQKKVLEILRTPRYRDNIRRLSASICGCEGDILEQAIQHVANTAPPRLPHPRSLTKHASQ